MCFYMFIAQRFLSTCKKLFLLIYKRDILIYLIYIYKCHGLYVLSLRLCPDFRLTLSYTANHQVVEEHK